MNGTRMSMRPLQTVAVVLAVLTPAVVVPATAPQVQSATSVLITNAAIFDGKHEQLASGMSVLVEHRARLPGGEASRCQDRLRDRHDLLSGHRLEAGQVPGEARPLVHALRGAAHRYVGKRGAARDERAAQSVPGRPPSAS